MRIIAIKRLTALIYIYIYIYIYVCVCNLYIYIYTHTNILWKCIFLKSYHDKFGLRCGSFWMTSPVVVSFTVEEEFELSDWLKAETQEACTSVMLCVWYEAVHLYALTCYFSTMSELNDYLEGKITFEEFERRREERKAKDKVISCRFYSSVYMNVCNTYRVCYSAYTRTVKQFFWDVIWTCSVVWSSMCDSCCVSGAEGRCFRWWRSRSSSSGGRCSVHFRTERERNAHPPNRWIYHVHSQAFH